MFSGFGKVKLPVFTQVYFMGFLFSSTYLCVFILNVMLSCLLQVLIIMLSCLCSFEITLKFQKYVLYQYCLNYSRFKMSLSVSTKYLAEIFTVIALDLQINLKRTDILKTLYLLIINKKDNSIFFHCFQVFHIFFHRDLQII